VGVQVNVFRTMMVTGVVPTVTDAGVVVAVQDAVDPLGHAPGGSGNEETFSVTEQFVPSGNGVTVTGAMVAFRVRG
jgi:hypothetical protein